MKRCEGILREVVWGGRRFLAQSRKGAKRCRVSKGFLCVFAALREKQFLSSKAQTGLSTVRAKPLQP